MSNTITIDGRPLFRKNYETGLLVKRLTKLEKGEQIGYDELNHIIKGDVQSDKGRASLTSARRIAEREHGVVTDTIPTVGLKRCTDPEIVILLKTANNRTQRAQRRAVQKTLRVDIDQLDEAQKGTLTDELQKTTLTTMVLDPKYSAITAARVFVDQSNVPMSVADDLVRLMASHNKRH
jgi:hypothetical protein